MVRSALGGHNPPQAPKEADLGEDTETGATKAMTFGQDGKVEGGKAMEMVEVVAGQIEPFYIFEDNSKLQSTEELRNKITELEVKLHNLKLKLIQRTVESCAYILESAKKDEIIQQKEKTIQEKEKTIQEKDRIINVLMRLQTLLPAARKDDGRDEMKDSSKPEDGQ